MNSNIGDIRNSNVGELGDKSYESKKMFDEKPVKNSSVSKNANPLASSKLSNKSVKK